MCETSKLLLFCQPVLFWKSVWRAAAPVSAAVGQTSDWGTPSPVLVLWIDPVRSLSIIDGQVGGRGPSVDRWGKSWCHQRQQLALVSETLSTEWGFYFEILLLESWNIFTFKKLYESF